MADALDVILAIQAKLRDDPELSAKFRWLLKVWNTPEKDKRYRPPSPPELLDYDTDLDEGDELLCDWCGRLIDEVNEFHPYCSEECMREGEEDEPFMSL